MGGCHQKIQEEGQRGGFAGLPLAGPGGDLGRAEVAVAEPRQGR